MERVDSGFAKQQPVSGGRNELVRGPIRAIEVTHSDSGSAPTRLLRAS